MWLTDTLGVSEEWSHSTSSSSFHTFKKRCCWWLKKSMLIKYAHTRWYEFWSSKLCEGDLITCMICIPNEFWSTFEALHIIGLFSDHVLKMKFGPLSNCRQNELCSTFVPMIASKIKSGSKFIFGTIWKWINLYYEQSLSHTSSDQSSYPRLYGLKRLEWDMAVKILRLEIG